MDIKNLWNVSFNPITNQFDVDIMWSTITGNLDMLFNHRDDCEKQDNWMIIFISESQQECHKFIEAVKKQIKTGNTPLENWSYEDFFNESKN